MRVERITQLAGALGKLGYEIKELKEIENAIYSTASVSEPVRVDATYQILLKDLETEPIEAKSPAKHDSAGRGLKH